MRDLLTFDPGDVSGWAWFHEGELSLAWYGSFEDLIAAPPRPKGTESPNVLIESPHGRPHEKDVNALLSIAIKVGRLTEFYRHLQVETVWPTTWKGSVPKKIHNARVLRTLTPVELARVPLRPRAKDVDHNCADAIGLGLWKLGRLR